ncbi:hypothetical protein ACFVU3_11655 [Streptomyces sp. NPDC058052]|uniref:hypothetical protein n=1 Tax=Streptomyces sp. NPDC058052 TaxID=3346316 RepID=UPI0036E89015
MRQKDGAVPPASAPDGADGPPRAPATGFRGGADAVPLTALFPSASLSPADVDTWNRAARTVDAADGGQEAAAWEWFPEHAAFPAARTGTGTPIVLGRTVVVPGDRGDHLEFPLHVVWTDQGRLAVDTAVNVACWCASDHATHDVDAVRIVVGEDVPLLDAFRAGAARLARRPAEPHDADHWRATAGLPVRAGRAGHRPPSGAR